MPPSSFPRRVALVASLQASLVTPSRPVAAQHAPAAPPAIVSMGQPPRWQPYALALGRIGGATRDGVAGVGAGLFHPVGSPVTGVFGVALEGHAAAGGGVTRGGARLLGVTRAINLGYGVDWDARAGNAAFVLSLNTALRRGGLLGRGTTVRLDWLPARDRVEVGLALPLGDRWAGRTRPRHTGVALERVASPARAVAAPPARGADPVAGSPLDSALRTLREGAAILAIHTNFFSDLHDDSEAEDVERTRRLALLVRDSLRTPSASFPEGRGHDATGRAYQRALVRAFALAAGDTARGAAIAARARAGLLAEVLVPYDRLFGQVKERQHDISPLLDAARGDFGAWLRDSSRTAPGRQAAIAAVHARWLDAIDAVHEGLVRKWRDSRRVWLPLQLALAPDEHDTQAELDALVARLVGRDFSDGNRVRWLHEVDVQLEVGRTITTARDWHLLWVHDVAGRRASGAVDRVAFRQVADVYFPALTQAVERFDETGRLTTYLLFLDQNFYEPNGGRLWMTILEDPLGARIAFPPGDDSLATVLRERQAALRAAVARSRGLQALAATRGGARWLRRTVRVHVSITQPSDFTFRSHRILPPVPLLPDNLMRDHRKIAVYDATEADPLRGGMVVSGVGIGEQYASPTWEDRGLLVRGPAVLEVRAAARRLLRRNGVRDDELPPALREATGPVVPGAVDTTNTSDVTTGRAMQLHNEPGFGAKEASIARAVLFTLAPPGSVLVAPDGLWLGSVWAGQLAGAALRGVQVHVIAPAIANAPSSGFPQMSRTVDVLRRLLQVQDIFADDIARAGGALRIGLFASRHDVNDIAALSAEVVAGIRREPWLRAMLPWSADALAVLDSAPAALARAGYRPFTLGRDLAPRLPQLHRKTILLADAAELQRLGRDPGWPAFMTQWFRWQVARTQAATTGDTLASRREAAETGRLARALFHRYWLSRPDGPPARSFHLTVGTQNMDPRGMMLDGEAVFVLSGESALAGVFDLHALLARTTWIRTATELEALLPAYDGWRAKLGRFMAFVL